MALHEVASFVSFQLLELPLLSNSLQRDVVDHLALDLGHLTAELRGAASDRRQALPSTRSIVRALQCREKDCVVEEHVENIFVELGQDARFVGRVSRE